MKLKYLLTAALSFAISLSALAQNNLGFDYYKLGELDLAKGVLTKEVAQDPIKSNYFLGEIAYREGKLDEARAYYQKALANDAENPYGLIGITKLDFKANAKEATKTLNNIAKKNKKDADILVEVAQAFLDNGQEEDALAKAEEARKADKKSPWVYIFLGDYHLSKKQAGDAAAQYDQAVTFDPNCAVANIKNAKIYMHINAEQATDRLKKAIESRPEYTVTYKYLGDSYYDRGFYQEAMDAYNKFFATGNYAIKDITNYAAANFFTDNYAEAGRLIAKGLEHNPNDFVLNRLKMYTLNKEQKYDEAAEAAAKFFAITRTDKDTVKYIVLDYTSYANILKAKGDIEGAMAQIDKAIELDPTQVVFYKEIAADLANNDNYGGAAQMQAKYIAKAGEAAEAQDYFQLGRYYYMGASELRSAEDEETIATKNGYIAEGDKAFAEVATRIEDSHLGNFWRARIQTLADPESTEGLAKPYYEAAVETILSKEDHNNDRELVEAYTYLSYYNYLQWDSMTKAKKNTEAKEAKENMQKYTDLLLGVDPENATGLQFKQVLEQ